MPTRAPQPFQRWPLRPAAPQTRRDWAAQFLALERVPSQGKVTGLSPALAAWLGVDVLLIRVLFVITAFSSGLGLILYVASWLLTRDDRTGSAPLDRVGTHWHELPPRVVVGWAAGLSVLLSLTFGAAIGIRAPSIAVLALMVWLGSRARQRIPGPPRPMAVVGSTPALSSRSSHTPITPRGPGAGASSPRPSTVPLALAVLGAAGLAAGLTWETSPGNMIVSAAAALLVVGIGLVLTAWRGRSVLLVLCGIVLSVTLVVATLLALRPVRQLVAPAEQSDLRDLVLTDAAYAFDLANLDVVTDSTWTIVGVSSTVALGLPSDENVHVQVRYTGSVVGLPDAVHTGDGTVRFQHELTPADPVLTIVLNVTSSDVWVGAP